MRADAGVCADFGRIYAGFEERYGVPQEARSQGHGFQDRGSEDRNHAS